jgi:hypothetical protein
MCQGDDFQPFPLGALHVEAGSVGEIAEHFDR